MPCLHLTDPRSSKKNIPSVTRDWITPSFLGILSPPPHRDRNLQIRITFPCTASYFKFPPARDLCFRALRPSPARFLARFQHFLTCMFPTLIILHLCRDPTPNGMPAHSFGHLHQKAYASVLDSRYPPAAYSHVIPHPFVLRTRIQSSFASSNRILPSLVTPAYLRPLSKIASGSLPDLFSFPLPDYP